MRRSWSKMGSTNLGYLFANILLHCYSSIVDAKKFQPPHIILIYADDLGWNDVSYHGSPQIPTPNIDSLVFNGVMLNNYYGEWLCTPSRGALLTGKYPLRLGLQHGVIFGGERTALPKQERILPQYLKDLGYVTHMIGKWHLGYYNYEYMPNRRGFDHFFGYLNGFIDYYDYIHSVYTLSEEKLHFVGIDLYNDTTPITNYRGVYATRAFTKKAEEVIFNHKPSKPLFLYLSHLAVHAGVLPRPLQAPGEEIRKFRYVKNKERRIHAAMMSLLDESVGLVFKALDKKGMLGNCIFMFVSDNGAEINPQYGGYGSNYPLRGSKWTPWEGGIRLPAVLWSPLLKLDKPRRSEQFMHVSDWLPTLYRAAGGDPKDLGKIDGHDMWEALCKDTESPRKDAVHALDPVWGVSSYRRGHLKVVNGTVDDGYQLWYGPTGFEDFGAPLSMTGWVFKNGSLVEDVLRKRSWWIAEDRDRMYARSRVHCKEPHRGEAYRCDPTSRPCLFNITADPCEYHDLADQYPEIVSEMMRTIERYAKQALKPQSKPSDPLADPLCHDFTFVPWLEPNYFVDCDFAS